MAEQLPRNVRSSVHSFKGEMRSSSFAQWQPYDSRIVSTSSSYGGGHYGWQNLGGIDTGGPWFMDRTIYSIEPIIVNNLLVRGPCWAPTIQGWSSSAAMLNTVDDLKGLGTKALALATPNNPAFSLSQAIGELRKDGIPAVVGTDLLKDKARFLKGSGSEYLNVEFGWKPLVSDLHKFARSVKAHHEIIKGYQAQSDRKIRRRHTFPPFIESRSIAGLATLAPLNQIAMQASASTTETKSTRSWFSGAFRYHVPVGDDLVGKLGKYESYANKLLGTRITPEVVWNLAPWSWAADWFSNTGDIMQNISNLGTDGMTMQYGYMMRHMEKETSTTFTWDQNGVKPGGYFRKTETSKRRLPASPYSFTTTFDGLSNRQKAITAAIGITRVR